MLGTDDDEVPRILIEFQVQEEERKQSTTTTRQKQSRTNTASFSNERPTSGRSSGRQPQAKQPALTKEQIRKEKAAELQKLDIELKKYNIEEMKQEVGLKMSSIVNSLRKTQ